MRFKDRAEAGKMLANALEKYKGKDAVVYALPRGGVVTAGVVAEALKAPLDLIITRKIGHPENPEYAIAALSQNGNIVYNNKSDIESVLPKWLDYEIKRQNTEVLRRRKLYLAGKTSISSKGRTAILIDDGAATGLTLTMGIKELKKLNPKKIVVAIPVIPQNIYERIKKETNEIISLIITSHFKGSVGSYYENFSEVSDDEVVSIMNSLTK